MNDLNRNTRTLIVSFVIAIMFLVPLRFVEVGQGLSMPANNSQVLGEVSEVVAPVVDNTARLEEPYNELENQNCVDKTTMNKLEGNVLNELQKEQLSAGDKSKLLDDLRIEELKACN